jgi:hypothetical protein
MIGITKTKQLNTFDTIKSILSTSTVLKTKFKDSSFHEFEPSLKSLKISDIPFIVINLPDTDTDLLVLNNSTNLKKFSISIKLVIDYLARDKYKDYASAIISTLEGNTATLEKQGYYDLIIEHLGADIDLVDNKKVIAGEFELSLVGNVTR